MDKFQFDYWLLLSESNPSEFEKQRKLVIDKEIAKSDAEIRDRLRVNQINYDAIHACNTPTEALVKFSAMLEDMSTKLSMSAQSLKDVSNIDPNIKT